MSNHESLFSFSDSLTTLTFIVASDLSEAQRERLTNSLSLKGMNVTVHTHEAVKTVFLESCCTPKSSMDNPSLRVNRHGGSTGRTLIVENYAEDKFGQRATDEVTGEQGYIDDERSCFWIRDDNEYAWQSRPFKGRQVRRRKGKGKRKKENGSKGKRGKKGFSNGNEGLQEGGFRTYQPEKGASNEFNPHKGRDKDQKR